MTPSPSLPPHASLESLRKQAKKLARHFAAGDPDALSRVRAQLPAALTPLSLRNAQLVLAREYGFPGWHDLRSALLRLRGNTLDWAAAEAERAIHANSREQLSQLIRNHPDLLSWHNKSGDSLLGFATSSFGDSGDPYREQMFTRLECAQFLLDSGAIVDPYIWENAIRARSSGVLRLLSRKGLLPQTLNLLAALGDYDAVRKCLDACMESRQPATAAGTTPAELTQAFLTACRFQHRAAAALILDRCIDRDPALGQRVEQWRGRSSFVDYLAAHAQHLGHSAQTAASLWQIVVRNQLRAAINEDNLPQFTSWLPQLSDLPGESHLAPQVELIEHAVLKDRGPFITRLLESTPTIATVRPPSSALIFALEYGKAHLIPLLTPVWPLPHDLCHASGTGDFARVKHWFDDAGHPRLGSLARHYPANHSAVLRNLHWTPPTAQHVLDAALAWACMNRHFEIASFLLDHGAGINTNWSTHEPASILHECAIQGNFEAAQFLIDHGIDLTIRDHRWNATAYGWAYHAAKDKEMADLLARAESERPGNRRLP